MMNIVSIGGGTGLYILLRGLKKYNCNLTAVVSMADDGGSTGKLRDEFGILPPGDVRRCIVALSESSDLMKEIFNYRFKNGFLKDHNLGNIIITALSNIYGDVDGIRKACTLLNIKGKVLPVTTEKVRLCAELENGEIIKGETNIDIPKHDPNLKIKKIWLEPEAKIYRDAEKEIINADIITLGPGDLYTSVLPNLIVKGVKEAISTSNAKIIYICNLMTKAGETHGFTVKDFASEVERYLNRKIDYIIYNKARIHDRNMLKKYKEEGKEQVEIDEDLDERFMGFDLLNLTDLARHDSDKLAKAVLRLGILESLK